MSVEAFDLFGKGISALAECLELHEQLKTRRPVTGAEKLNAVVKGLFLGFQALSAGAEASGASPATLEDLKAAELGGSLAHLLTDVNAKMGSPETTGKKFESFFGNLTKTMRIASEQSIHAEKKFLNMAPEELESATRAGYTKNADGELEWVEEKPVTEAECKKNLEEAQSCASVYLVGEMIGKTHSVTFAKELLETFLSYTCFARADHRDRMARDVRRFIDRETIPDAFEDDEVLSQYICPLTLCPIRYPLKDPNTGHLFEAHAIIGWLERNPSSPLTRSPLRQEDLQEVPEIRRIIEQRLGALEEERSDLFDS